MATIHKEIVVAAPPNEVWAAVRDVGAVHQRLMPGYVSATYLDGDTRTLVLPDGGRVKELIVAVDDERRRLAYAVIEGRMPLIYHHASFQVFADGTQHSRLVWITDALPHERADEIRVRVERGGAVMKETLEAAVRTANNPEQ